MTWPSRVLYGDPDSDRAHTERRNSAEKEATDNLYHAPSFIFYPSSNPRPEGSLFYLNRTTENHVMRILQVSSNAFEFVQRVMAIRDPMRPTHDARATFFGRRFKARSALKLPDRQFVTLTPTVRYPRG
jgi:hypothetical protein